MKEALAFVAVVIAPLVAAAQTTEIEPTDRYLGARGVGLASCADFLRLADHKEMQRTVVSWAYGLWTGFNFAAGSESEERYGISIDRNVWDKTVEPDALVARIKARCIEGKNEGIYDAISDIFWELPPIE